MDTKLTLRLNKSIIEKAKQYASERNTSLSKMIENYLQALTNKKEDASDISPLVESLTGVIDVPSDDMKKDYSDFLTHKYK